MVIKFLRLKMLNFKGSRGERTIEFNDTVTLILGAGKSSVSCPLKPSDSAPLC